MPYFAYCLTVTPQVDGPYHDRFTKSEVCAWVEADSTESARLKLKRALEVEDAWKIEEIEFELQCRLEYHPWLHQKGHPEAPQFKAGLEEAYKRLISTVIGVEIFGCLRDEPAV